MSLWNFVVVKTGKMLKCASARWLSLMVFNEMFRQVVLTVRKAGKLC